MQIQIKKAKMRKFIETELESDTEPESDTKLELNSASKPETE